MSQARGCSLLLLLGVIQTIIRISEGASVKGLAENLAFTVGFGCIVVGFSYVHISLAFIVPGSIVCGLLIANRRGGKSA